MLMFRTGMSAIKCENIYISHFEDIVVCLVSKGLFVYCKNKSFCRVMEYNITVYYAKYESTTCIIKN